LVKSMSLENPTWLEKRPLWQKVLTVAVLIIGSYAIVFWWGTKAAEGWAESAYLENRKKSEAIIAQHELNEKIMAAKNEELRLQNEAQAELLKTADSAADAKRIAEFQKLQDERKKKSDEIENANPGESLAGLCDDAKRAGIALSFCR